MNKSFLDEPGFFAQAIAIAICVPLIGALISSCINPTISPEQKAEMNSAYAADMKEEVVILKPRPGVECYVLRGVSSTNTRTMSCVVIPPVQ